MIKLYNLPPLKPSYYLSAMDLYQEMKSISNPVFVILTDDVKWVKSQLLPRLKNSDVYLLSDGDYSARNSVALDLATLSICNHTILSYGTFSFWGGFLSGGLRIIPPMLVGPLSTGHGIRSGLVEKWNYELLRNFSLPDFGLDLPNLAKAKK